MQELKAKRIKIVHGGGQKVSTSSISQRSFIFGGFFRRSQTGSSKNNASASFARSPVKSGGKNVPRADLATLRTWIALEEKIVHDYREQKSIPPLVSPTSKPLTVLPGSQTKERKPTDLSQAGKGFKWSGFFAFLKPRSQEEAAKIILRKPVAKMPDQNVVSKDRASTLSSAALEEKIIHVYHDLRIPFSGPVFQAPIDDKRRSRVVVSDLDALSIQGNILRGKGATQSQSATPAFVPKTPAKRPANMFENFTTRTAVSLPSSAPGLKESVKRPNQKSLGRYFSALWGWLVAGGLVFLCIHVFFAKQDISQKLARLENEKKGLDLSYGALQDVAKRQTIEIQGLTTQLRGLSLELKKVQEDKSVLAQALEKRYRKELNRTMIRYESEIAALKSTVRTQNAIVSALKAQSHAMNNIMDQAGISALSGAAAGLYQDSPVQEGTFTPEGKVTSINLRQSNVVVSIGGSQGASSGRWVTISRNGIGLVNGIIERVYPTMSVIMIRDANMMKMIKMGDDVSFS